MADKKRGRAPTPVAAARSEPGTEPRTEPEKPPVPWHTIRVEATEMGLFEVVSQALIGKFSPSRKRLLAGNVVMAVAKWRETFRDCGCWRVEEGFALCAWHERAFVSARTEAHAAGRAAAMAEIRERVRAMNGTVCKCGLAASYHGPNPPILADHEYERRYPDLSAVLAVLDAEGADRE